MQETAQLQLRQATCLGLYQHLYCRQLKWMYLQHGYVQAWNDQDQKKYCRIVIG